MEAIWKQIAMTVIAMLILSSTSAWSQPCVEGTPRNGGRGVLASTARLLSTRDSAGIGREARDRRLTEEELPKFAAQGQAQTAAAVMARRMANASVIIRRVTENGKNIDSRPEVARGTGVAISACHIITAGHVVYRYLEDANGKPLEVDIRTSPEDYRVEIETKSGIKAEGFVLFSGMTPGRADGDFAIIKLDSSVAVEPLSMAYWLSRPTTELIERPAIFGGYSGDRIVNNTPKFLVDVGCNTLKDGNPASRRLYGGIPTTCKAVVGNSGGPVAVLAASTENGVSQWHFAGLISREGESSIGMGGTSNKTTVVDDVRFFPLQHIGPKVLIFLSKERCP